MHLFTSTVKNGPLHLKPGTAAPKPAGSAESTGPTEATGPTEGGTPRRLLLALFCRLLSALGSGVATVLGILLAVGPLLGDGGQEVPDLLPDFLRAEVLDESQNLAEQVLDLSCRVIATWSRFLATRGRFFASRGRFFASRGRFLATRGRFFATRGRFFASRGRFLASWGGFALSGLGCRGSWN